MLQGAQENCEGDKPVAKNSASCLGSLSRPVDDLRPRLAPALETLIANICAQTDSLKHVDARRILVVSGQARGYARASIRGLNGVVVRVDGRRRHYELGLRPLWYRQSSLERRLESLVHELWHIAVEGHGQLDPDHRHLAASKKQDAREIKALLRHALKVLPARSLAALGHHGEVLMPTWLQRPVLVEARRSKKNYSDRDLFWQPVMMLTPASGRSVWWS